MAELKEPFASFWAYIRGNFDEDRVNKMLDHLHHSLLHELQNPFAVGYTPQHLAYRVVIKAMSHVCNMDLLAAKHPMVRNQPQPDDQPVNIDGLKYLADSGQLRGELLLDILEGGRASANRHKLSAMLDPPKAMTQSRATLREKASRSKDTRSRIIPRGPNEPRNPNNRELSERAIWRGCDVDEIPIPTIVNINRHLEPHLPKLQSIWMIWLGLDKGRRVLIFRSQEKEGRHGIDDMVADRHRQEFRFIFLSYIQECLDFKRSCDFMKFHCEGYKAETDSWREMSEEVVVALKQDYVDQGEWR
ncbi:hypothetical protein ONZ43_g5750 [Nemania bipapillata]|uniref:Uncharacterized protein n=1 Tax=Nemania bipapillata TaxID=110536 RepID=A0ACC2I700_9PEZI|nr:hypothetical protein ONZ43_g5750 [Nemania bipapillata]